MVELELNMVAMKLHREVEDPLTAVSAVRCTGSAADPSALRQLPWKLVMAARLAANMCQLCQALYDTNYNRAMM